jgi:creatinine amidohydrolase
MQVDRKTGGGTEVPMKLPLLLEEMTVREVRGLLPHVKTAILPIGCTEQHGYHLPLCTDSLIPERVALEVAKRVPVFLLPVLRYSFSGGTLEGTVQIRPDTVYAVVKDLLESLLAQGFRGIIVQSGHGGGEHMDAVQRAATYVTLKCPECFIAVGGDTSETAAEILKGLAGRTHATTVETSLLLHLRPDLVRGGEMEWEHRPSLREPLEGPDRFVVRRQLEAEAKYRARVRIGVGADPSAGNAELGERIFWEKVESMVGLVEHMNELVKAL